MGGRGGSPNPGPQAPAAAQAPAGDVALQAVESAISEERNKAVTTMERVRGRLAALGMGREQQDAELRRLFRARKIILTPVNNQKMMTQAERDARIEVGGELKGLVMMT